MRDAVKGMRREVQATIEQNQTDSHQHDEEVQKAVSKIASELERLT